MRRSRRTWPGVGAPPHRDATAGPVLARRLLVALSWGFGAGLPLTEWETLAAAPSDPDTADTAGDAGVVTVEDLWWVLGELGRYLVQDGESGQAVYRVAHASLTSWLRPPYQPTQVAPFDPAALPVAEALVGRYRALLEAGVPATEPGYLWRYTWRHAAAAGPAGLELLRGLAGVDDALTADVAMAGLEVADTYATWGRWMEAVAPTEEAVGIYRGLAADNPAVLPDLAGALNNLGIRYSEVGRRVEAVAPTEEAVTLYRGLAADNPAVLPNLAGALSNLGIRYSQVGRRVEAVAPTEEAVNRFRGLAADNPRSCRTWRAR